MQKVFALSHPIRDGNVIARRERCCCIRSSLSILSNYALMASSLLGAQPVAALLDHRRAISLFRLHSLLGDFHWRKDLAAALSIRGNKIFAEMIVDTLDQRRARAG